MQLWGKEIEGNIQMILALGNARGEGECIVSLWLVNYVVHAESKAVYSS